MSKVIKKENMTIVIREYTDNQGNNKKVYKTVGELVTWQGDDGSNYQSFEMWGPTGSTQGKIFEQQQAVNAMQPQQPQQQNYQQQPKQQYNANNPPF